MNIQQIKEKYTCLDYLGDRVVRKVANGYQARCPWREDNHPSLTVSPNGRGWKDQATGEHGNLIDMVQRCLNTSDLSRVCAAFGSITPFSFHQSKILNEGKEKGNGFTFCDIKPLQSRALFAYLYHRKIDLQIAKQFLKEAHYSFREMDDGRYLYALAYANDKGGYELRSNIFKGGTTPKTITTHWLIDGAPVVVFEGFMDMLSFATLCGEVKHNYIVLNSCSMKESALEVLKTLQNQIYLCLDNDKGGDDATAFLLDALPSAVDIRSRFAPWKDVNDYLMNKKL